MKRYSQRECTGMIQGPREHPDGEWVRYEDAATLARERGEASARMAELALAIHRLPKPPESIGDGPAERVGYTLSLLMVADKPQPNPQLPEPDWHAPTQEAVFRRIFEQLGEWICDHGCDVEGCGSLVEMMERLRDFQAEDVTS